MHLRGDYLNFEEFELNSQLITALRIVGHTTPTEVQENAIPVALKGQDILAIAPTGTGKTLAFLLPIFEKLTKEESGDIKALILVPTRELAEQIYQVSVTLAKGTNIHSTVIYGGVNKSPQVKKLKRRSQIVIACPGRLLDHISDRNINLSKVNMLVLDEADTMCDMGFIIDIEKILKHIPQRRQNMFFAATMQKEIRILANGILRDPITVQIGEIAPVKTVSHSIYPVVEILKKRLILDLLDCTATGRVIIFTRTKHKAHWLSNHLTKAKYRVAELQGNMSQNRRQQAIDGFKNGKYDILVATDVASRGIDVSEVSHVINFDMPNSVDAYIHRIGRTGRAENVGEAITFTLPEDEYLLRKIEKTLGNSIEQRRLNDFDYGGFDPLKQSSNFKKSAQGKYKTTTYRKQNRHSRSSYTCQSKKRSYKPESK